MSNISNIVKFDYEIIESTNKELIKENKLNYYSTVLNYIKTSSYCYDNDIILSNSMNSSSKIRYFKDSEELIYLEKLNSEIRFIENNINQLEYKRRIKLIKVKYFQVIFLD